MQLDFARKPDGGPPTTHKRRKLRWANTAVFWLAVPLPFFVLAAICVSLLAVDDGFLRFYGTCLVVVAGYSWLAHWMPWRVAERLRPWVERLEAEAKAEEKNEEAWLAYERSRDIGRLV